MHQQLLDVAGKSEVLQSQCDAMSISEQILRDEISEADKVRIEIELRMSAQLAEEDVLMSKATEDA